ncbi:MAG: Periplasmic serine endoprotease DegP [Chromatiales bacterium USCg_Taylor]|nr:MAG: Periplasmic serine endoprotease DegP [Chromatiales bacterium USCg_Taylor]
MGLTHSFSRALLALAVLFSMQAAVGSSLPDFTDLASENAPAVVNIGTTLKESDKRADGAPPQLQIPDLPEDSPLNEFFRRFFGDHIEGPDLSPRSSLGSGLILSKDGYVISNYHVIKDADEIWVRLSDRREYRAKPIGHDERSDLAVLKIEATDLPIVKLGRSADLKVGEWVLAIGSPFGFDHSVTAGIVSAKGRALPNENYVPFIQTDVAINPGNSGGPLFNLDGEVVGVNSQIYSRTGGFMGLSFAIPVEVVMNVYHQIVAKGKVSRGWLGVLIQEVTRELAESFGMARPHGALVAKVLPDSPAAESGIQPGDVVVEFNGIEVDLSSDLPPLVGNTEVGKRVPLKLIREGDPKVVDIAVGELPQEEELKVASSDRGTADAIVDNRLKIAVKDLSRKQRKALEIEGDHGVVVEVVQPGPAKNAGIRKGDAILLIDNVKVKDSKHFTEMVAALPTGKPVPALIQRQGGPIFLAIKIAE